MAMDDYQVTLGGTRVEQVPGVRVTPVHPVIISVSRETDIPAFYMDWFLDRYARGYLFWKNPYRQDHRQQVFFDQTRGAVFWTKDPGALLVRLDEIDALGLHYYVQVTLNHYEGSGYEPGVPPLQKRIADFQELSRRLGRERVVWRFDPLLLSDQITPDDLAGRIQFLFSCLGPFCKRMVFSFVDISGYRGVTRNLKQYGLTAIRELTPDEKLETAGFLQRCSEKFGPLVMACSQELDLTPFGIVPGRCVDDRWFRKIAPHDPEFNQWLDRDAKKDKGQRPYCTCIVAKDVGEYSTCMHQCRYCYANRSDEVVAGRYYRHVDAMRQGVLPESIVPDTGSGISEEN